MPSPEAGKRSWDGQAYDQVSGPMAAMGREVLARLRLRGDETVVDAGCGSGKVTEALVELVPRGRVICVDSSADMLAAARERLGPAVELIHADLTELALPERADAILSTATFHWVLDHEALFARLHANLKPGGQLVAQCGGAGNISGVHAAAARVAAAEPYAPHFADWSDPRLLATPEDTERRLRDAGFREARAWLEAKPVTPEDPEHYLRTINLGAHLERLPDDLRAPFVTAVADALRGPGGVVIDYVRLNLDATA